MQFSGLAPNKVILVVCDRLTHRDSIRSALEHPYLSLLTIDRIYAVLYAYCGFFIL